MPITIRFLLVFGLLGCWPLLAQTHAAQARDLFYQRDDGVEPSAVSSAKGASLPVTHRLGVRYNLLKVNPSTKASTPVDPEGNFARGDCIALEFSPNRDGHLYVFNLASSGKWQLLLP